MAGIPDEDQGEVMIDLTDSISDVEPTNQGGKVICEASSKVNQSGATKLANKNEEIKTPSTLPTKKKKKKKSKHGDETNAEFTTSSFLMSMPGEVLNTTDLVMQATALVTRALFSRTVAGISVYYK
jgi:hypothetical protein